MMVSANSATGSAKRNQYLSQQRAEAVEREFAQGIRPSGNNDVEYSLSDQSGSKHDGVGGRRAGGADRRAETVETEESGYAFGAVSGIMGGDVV